MADIKIKYPSNRADVGYVVESEEIAAAIGGGALPVLTDYPETDASKAGTRFWYKGNEWHYMTQAEIDSTGWTGLVDVGFPAPVSKVYNPFMVFPEADGSFFPTTNLSFNNGIINPNASPLLENSSSLMSIVSFGQFVNRLTSFNLPILVNFQYDNQIITKFHAASLLSNLEDVGTAAAMVLQNFGLSAEVIDDFFEQLKPTTKTATINVSGNPGSTTCDPTIATAKGYTVITS